MTDPLTVSHSLTSRFSGLRARVVLWYLGLLAISLVVAVLALRQFLIVGLDDVGRGKPYPGGGGAASAHQR